MKDVQSLITDICHKEIECGCYNTQVNGISVYGLIRRLARNHLFKREGLITLDSKIKTNKLAVILNFLISIFQILKILILRKTFSHVYYAFPRVDKVNGLFMDKFTDPIIAECHDGDFVIFEQGRSGIHKKPRINSSNIIFVDCIAVLSRFFSLATYSLFKRKHHHEYGVFKTSVQKAFGKDFNCDELFKYFTICYYHICILSFILKKIKAKTIIGPARDYMALKFAAAHRLGMKAFELQHGIGFEKSLMYSGYEYELCMPDYFLAFGDNNPKDVYGINESKMINIGWAFQDYLDNIAIKDNITENAVLVVSEPEISENILNATISLADEYKNIMFYFRPHPHEELSPAQIESISQINNIMVQDRSVNVLVVLHTFKYVIGENSTVLYEALASGKKVGRLFTEGLHPKYLEESDRKCFWEIKTTHDFKTFLSDDVSSKESKSIYSKFDKELFKKTIGLI